jgi:hypothetical protein
MNEGKTNAKDLDVRVRERNLASGKLDAKTVDRYLAELPDVGDRAEIVDLVQPALVASEPDDFE